VRPALLSQALPCKGDLTKLYLLRQLVRRQRKRRMLQQPFRAVARPLPREQYPAGSSLARRLGTLAA